MKIGRMTQLNFIKRIGNKISKLMILALSILAIGGLITFYQYKINNLEVPEKTTVIVVAKDLKAGEIITGSHIKEKEVFKPDKLDDGITEMNKLIGKVALTSLVKGKEITEKEITNKENWYKGNEKEVGITFERFTDIVGGTGKPGDLVDFMLSYPAKEDELKNLILTEPKEIVSKIRLIEVFDDSNTSFKDSKEKASFKPITVLIKLTSDQEAKIDMALKEGRIYLRRHGNEIKDEDEKLKQSKIVITGSKN